jgi:hypothetical protein
MVLACNHSFSVMWSSANEMIKQSTSHFVTRSQFTDSLYNSCIGLLQCCIGAYSITNPAIVHYAIAMCVMN